jgi:adenine-specific DNA methylase
MQFRMLAKMAANRQGRAVRKNAEIVATELRETDLVFIDPPYSGVQYSRFYHVLETIARGRSITASGEGRYPTRDQRPQSDFSLKTRSEDAFRRLFRAVSRTGARAIVTFPAEASSNGLSGNLVEEIAAEFFVIEQEIVSSRFSTLGGNSRNRAARQDRRELILTLRSRG